MLVVQLPVDGVSVLKKQTPPPTATGIKKTVLGLQRIKKYIL